MPNITLIADWILQCLIALILLKSVLLWMTGDPRHPLLRVVCVIVDPILLPISALMPSTGRFDFSPVVAALIIWALQIYVRGGVV